MTPGILKSVANYFTDHPIYTKKRFAFVVFVVVSNVIISRLVSNNNYGFRELAIFSFFGFVGFIMPTIWIAGVRFGYINYKKPDQPSLDIKSVFSSLMWHLHALFFTSWFLFSLVWLTLALAGPYLKKASF